MDWSNERDVYSVAPGPKNSQFSIQVFTPIFVFKRFLTNGLLWGKNLRRHLEC